MYVSPASIPNSSSKIPWSSSRSTAPSRATKYSKRETEENGAAVTLKILTPRHVDVPILKSPIPADKTLSKNQSPKRTSVRIKSRTSTKPLSRRLFIVNGLSLPTYSMTWRTYDRMNSASMENNSCKYFSETKTVLPSSSHSNFISWKRLRRESKPERNKECVDDFSRKTLLALKRKRKTVQQS